ncbi:hypothetical protein ACH5RR_020384 [Cinchona calisaya]|uniref:Cyclin-dependent kinase inhibitor domain-containing protein n=1 Tax=Cinchona calisaya TaxID=153742 RepID=A0ABD2ZHM4_9GENT
MGKYMRKAKISDELAVMEVSQSTVRTAKILALQRLHSAAVPTSSDSSCYLQLRSRRLEKPSFLRPKSQQKPSSRKHTCQTQSRAKPSPRSRVSESVNSGSITRLEKEEGCFDNQVAEEIEQAQDFDLSVEASFGENNLDFERSTRESTPCSLIKDVDVTTPGSSTRQRTVNAVNQTRSRSSILENMPSAAEIEEFFARVEQQQQRQFIEKYNFDVVNDVPLPGRYEWVRANR